MFEDKRGEYYSKGYCIVAEQNCSSMLKGACGVCQIGELYRITLNELSEEGGLVEVCDETN
jgi:hypothetical protein